MYFLFAGEISVFPVAVRHNWNQAARHASIIRYLSGIWAFSPRTGRPDPGTGSQQGVQSGIDDALDWTVITGSEQARTIRMDAGD